MIGPSWHGDMRVMARHFHAEDVEVVETDAGRLLVPRRRGVRPFEVVTARHNLLVAAGITRLLNLLTAQGGGVQAYDATHSRLGVGDDSTAASSSQTDLQAGAGSTHRQFEVMDATYPQVSGSVALWRSTFTSGEANFAWSEWGIDVGTIAGTTVVAPLLNRKVAALGTKANGTVSQLLASLTIT